MANFYLLGLILILIWCFSVTHRRRFWWLYNPWLLGPILEELLYRGVLMTSFFEKSKYFLDCLLSAILFSFAHLLSYGFRLDLFEKYVVVGLILALLFRKTRSIYPSILVHMAWNIYLS